MRRPFEFLAAFYRGVGAEITGTELNFQWPLMQAGWMQHEYGPPTGHPDRIGDWTGASSLNRLVDLAINGLSDWFGVAPADAAQKLATVQGDETVDAFIARQAALIAPAGTGTLATTLAATMGADPAAPVAGFTPDERAEAVRMAMAMAALSPDFMLR